MWVYWNGLWHLKLPTKEKGIESWLWTWPETGARSAISYIHHTKEHPWLRKITSIFYDGNNHISVLQHLSTQACPFPIWSFSNAGTISIYSTDKNVLLCFQHNNINRSSKENRISVKWWIQFINYKKHKAKWKPKETKTKNKLTNRQGKTKAKRKRGNNCSSKTRKFLKKFQKKRTSTLPLRVDVGLLAKTWWVEGHNLAHTENRKAQELRWAF